MAFVITDECLSCGTCVDACPNEAIVQGDEHYVITEDCIECGTCVSECPMGAIVEE